MKAEYFFISLFLFPYSNDVKEESLKDSEKPDDTQPAKSAISNGDPADAKDAKEESKGLCFNYIFRN